MQIPTSTNMSLTALVMGLITLGIGGPVPTSSHQISDNLIFTKRHEDLFMYQCVWKLTLYQDLGPLGKLLREVQSMTAKLRTEYHFQLQDRNVSHLAPYKKRQRKCFTSCQKHN